MVRRGERSKVPIAAMAPVMLRLLRSERENLAGDAKGKGTSG
jgi:hypothetical protein